MIRTTTSWPLLHICASCTTASIKSWGLHLAKTKCHAKARVAVARKLAVVMHAMWRDGTVYTGDAQMTDSERAAAVASKERRISYAKS